MSHAPPETSAFTSTDSRADVSHLHAPASSTCLHAHTCPLHMTSSSITPVWPGPTWKSNPVRTACKKKKKSFDQVELWLYQKVKIFKNGLFHSVFWVHSDFEIRFFIWSSEIVQTVQFLKNWLLHRSWPKSQNFQEVPVLPNFSHRFHFWGLFLHLRIRNWTNSMILQLLALIWALTKDQDVWAKIALFRFSHGFWLWNPLICFGLGNHLCDTLLRSTSRVQNLSSQDQNLRFIHLVWILSRL